MEDFEKNHIEVWKSVLRYVNHLLDVKNLCLTSKALCEVARKHIGRLSWTNVHTEKIRNIQHIPVENLMIRGCLNDKNLQEISKISSLKRLIMSDNRDVTSSGLSCIQCLSELRDLNVSRCELNNACMLAVCGITSLQVQKPHIILVTGVSEKLYSLF